MDETNQLPNDDKINARHQENGSSGKKWRILALLSLSIIVSYAPIIIGCLVFIEGDFVEDNVIL